MTDRFQWLEFEEEGGSKPPSLGRGRVSDGGKDEHSHLAEADRAFIAGEFEPALRNYSAALKYKGDMEEAWTGQVRCMALLGQSPLALRWGQKGLDLLPSSRPMASALAYALARADQPEAALDLSDQILSKGESAVADAPWFWFDRGACLLASGQETSAASCFDRAAEIARHDADWLQRIGHEYLLGNAPARAMPVLNKALEQRSDRAFLWILTCRAATRMNLAERAKQAYEQARTLDPVHPELPAPPPGVTGGAAGRPCWIATLVFADATHPVVEGLRTWRNEVWLRTRLGSAAAALYDITAPSVCRLLAGRARLHRPLRYALTALAHRVSPGDAKIRMTEETRR